MSAEIVYWNAAVSFDLHPDFTAGLTLTYATLELDADTQTIVSDPLQILVSSSHPRLPSQSDTDVYRTMAHGTDDDLTWSIGVHWHPGSAFAEGSSPWRFGASMRKGARFGLEETTTLNGLPDRRFENSIAVPDQYSIGASYRPDERWLFSGQVDRVNFSDLLDDYRTGVNYVTSPHLAQGAFSTGPSHAIRYELNDGYVYRLGLEYSMPTKEPDRGVAFRGGWSRLPDTVVQMTHFNSSDTSVNRTYREAFPEGDEENHFSAGVGLGLGRSAFQVGVDASESGTLWLANYVYAWRSR
jgi:long-subunit fatty acid transport protein